MEAPVRGCVFDIAELKDFMDAEAAKAEGKFFNKIAPSQFLEQTMHLFGVVTDGHLFILDNGVDDAYNPLNSYIDEFNRYYEDAKIGFSLTEAPVQLVPDTIDISEDEWEAAGIQMPAEDD